MPEDFHNVHDVYLHIRIVIGIVLGLALTRILAGLSRFIQHPGRDKVYAVHLLWVAIVLVTAIHFWWWEFHLSTIWPWRFTVFGFVLFYAFLLFLLAALLFPDDMRDYDGYRDYFLSRRAWFFGLFALTLVTDYADTLLKGPAHLAYLGPEYQVRIAVTILLCLIAARTRAAWFHLGFPTLYLVYYLSWIERRYSLIDLG